LEVWMIYKKKLMKIMFPIKKLELTKKRNLT